MPSRYNPVRSVILLVGAALAQLGLVDRRSVVRATDLSWPRIVTGIARMSKSAADVAMVGLALGPAAIAGVGFATPFWGLAFTLGGGVAGGTISMVSRFYGAGAEEELERTVKTSVLASLVVVVPVAVLCWAFPRALVGLLDSGPALDYGARYLGAVAVGMPFAALNLIASRTLVGADDAWTPMVLRTGGAVVNVVVNAVLLFGLGTGVEGAAAGTVVGNVVVTGAFAVGLIRGRLPGVGAFPVRVSPAGPAVDRATLAELTDVGTPLLLRNLAGRGADFPKLAIVGLFGPNVAAAFVVALRVRDLLDTPNWGFSLASSTLVGQALGRGEEREAAAWGRDVLRFTVAVYAVLAASVLVFAEQVSRLFVDDPAILPLVTAFVVVTCVSVVFRGVDGGCVGPLRASGDTRWPLYAQLAGMYLFAVPLAYLGAVTPLGVWGLYVALVAEAFVPAAITYYRFRSGTWMAIGRAYRGESGVKSGS
ncbi:MATE family efflux transporter [Halomarina litorea]|uniref:MATE family efflux transporter n=1 Tax=Halomarina litorea TaxID=2961595 RepID=UPI0020C5A912|nr:MATE family efflux transporter [Halomarina sp. BCD28]